MSRSSTMRAAVVTGPGKFQVANVTLPEPGPGEVRIRLEGCGVCASNVPTWIGMPWTKYPTAPGALGHEGWGLVDTVGEEVSSFKAGDRVAAISHHAYAEFDVVDAAAVVKLPDALGGSPFPGEALGCAMNIFSRSQIRAGETVAIIGIGFLGAILTRLAHNAGAKVLAISRRPCSLRMAEEMGANEALPMNDHAEIVEQVKASTRGKFCECVIEAVGKQWPLDLAAELVQERGRLIVAGYHQDGPRQVNMQLWNWKGLDVINAHERALSAYKSGIEQAVGVVTSNLLDPFPLFTHQFPLEELGDALDATRDRPNGFMKGLVIYA